MSDHDDATGSRAAKRYSWTQPLCNGCWAARGDGDFPARLILAEHETCCQCGADTQSGIYVRVDPTSVPYPTMEKD